MQKQPLLTVSDHPLIHDKLSELRSRDTAHGRFRKLLEDITVQLFYLASADLPVRKQSIETPLEKTQVSCLAADPVIIPILRAGLGMSTAITSVCDQARIGMIGLYRDEKTLQPVHYYLGLPQEMDKMPVFVVDPMLATGGSAVAAIDLLKTYSPASITFIAIISTPEGVERLNEAHPGVHIYTAAVDRQLNDQAYILPGLGDAGDRYFGT